MSGRKVTQLIRLVVVLLFSLGLSQSAAGQSSKLPDDKETLQALLSEVTMLRQALQTLQRMSLDNQRGQLLFNQVQAQKQEVQSITGRLESVRDDFTKVQQTIPNVIEQQKVLGTQIQQEIDPTQRAQLELELKRAKRALEIYTPQLDRLRDREQELITQLQVSKTRLEELESRLDSLERSIESERERLLADKPSQVRKP